MTPDEEKELTFLDLVVLQRIGPDTTLERFGSKINSSFFEAAGILGTIKLKGYIDIESSIGASKVAVSEAGKKVLELAEEKSKEDVDSLDRRVMGAIAKGNKNAEAVTNAMNIRSGDLAYRLYKLVKHGYIDYSVRTGKVGLMLTESGFKALGPEEKQEEPGEDGLGAEIARDDERPVPKPSQEDIDEVRRRTKMEYYMKRWGKYWYWVAGAVALIVLLAVYFLFFSPLG